MEAERQTYILWQRFSMPIENRTRDAIAVSADNGKKLLSAYTLMVELILLQIWSLVVLVVISIRMRKAHSPNIGAASAAIWNSQGSAASVLTLMAKYILYMKRRSERVFAFSWMFAATVFLALAYAVSILVPSFLILGNGAPVEPGRIFVPDTILSKSEEGNPSLLEWFFLGMPSSLRAAGSVNATTLQKVHMSKPEKTSGVNGIVERIGYGYTITGADFGLQHAPGLRLKVEGSCFTEYSWLDPQTSGTDVNNVRVDKYILFPEDDGSVERQLSLFDGRAPTAFVHLGFLDNISKTNATFAIAVSSAGRYSYTSSEDPLYATGPSGKNATYPQYVVKSRRPILSCWENDVWFNKDKQSAVSNLSTLSGLHMSENLRSIFFERFLGVPMIVTLGSRLGNRAIQSSATSVEQLFDAGASSMEKDLHYLVAAAYIASTRILADTTTILPNSTNLTNLALDPSTGKSLPDLGDFVVFSRNIATLSVKVLIIVPVVLVLLFLLIVTLNSAPASWNKAQALRATILYSCLEEKNDERGGRWDRSTEIAHLNADVEQLNFLRPEFRQEGGLFWVRANN